jgi:hypothetical protein
LIGLVGLWYLTPLLNNISVILVVSFIAGEHWSTHYIENSISLKPKSSSMSFDFKTKSRIYQTENRMKI